MLIQCLMCDHYYLFQKKCRAFPKGIPEQIYNGKVNHAEPFPGDDGIVFTPLVVSESLDLNPKPVGFHKTDVKTGIKRSLVFREKSRKFVASIEIPLPPEFQKKNKKR